MTAPGAVRCTICERDFVVVDGVIDLAPPEQPAPNLTQRLMETRVYARFYEDVMRPRLTRTVTRRSMEDEYALSTRWLDLQAGSRVLDIACGTGNFTRAFAKAAPDADLIVGADLSWSMLDEARPLLVREELEERVSLVRLDAIAMPVATASYDRLHCHAALHFMSDPDAALRSFARVLERDGICVIGTFLQSRDPLRRLSKALSRRLVGFGWFDEKDLVARMERAGLRVEETSVDGDAITLRARRM